MDGFPQAESNLEALTPSQHRDILLNQNRILELVVQGQELSEILTTLILMIEAQAVGMKGSILLLDPSGQKIHCRATPNLPGGYVQAIEGLQIGPKVGSCGTAIYRRESVIVTDIATDPLWEAYRDLALAFELRACWSMPIFSSQQQVLGCFALYYHEPMAPTPYHLALIASTTTLASIVIERHHREQERELREQALALAQQQYQGIFENALDGIFQSSPDGRYLKVNPALARIYGYDSPAQVVAERTDIAHQTYVQPGRRKEFIRRMAQKDTVQNFESQVYRRDGTVIWVNENARTVRDAQGQILYYEGLIEDITPRKLAEEQMYQANQRLRLHVEQTPLGVIELDVEGKVLRWNRAAEGIFGWSAAEMLGQSCTYFVPETLRPYVQELWQNLITHQGGQRSTNENITKDGRTIMCDWYNTPLIDESGQVIGVACLVEDKTTAHQMEEERRQAQEQRLTLERTALQMAELQKLHQLKDDFLSTVSHELRTPMTNLRLAIKMIGQAKHPAEMRRYLNILERECNREIDLINDLLDLQRLEAGMSTLTPVELQVQEWLPLLLGDFQNRAHEKRQHLELYLRTEQPLTILSDRQSLERILFELLNNACKYTPQDGRITLELQTAQPEGLYLSVTNSGPGISMDEIPRIFDKFYRIPNSDPWNHGGTGLGLALVKCLVEQVGGQITASSADEETTFRVWLPVRLPQITLH